MEENGGCWAGLGLGMGHVCVPLCTCTVPVHMICVPIHILYLYYLYYLYYTHNWECCESCYERTYSGYPLSSLVQKRREMSI